MAINYYSNFSSFIKGTSRLKFILITLVLTYILPLLFLLPFFTFGIDDMHIKERNNINSMGVFLMFLFAVVIAPIYETIIYQVIPYHILKKSHFLFRNKWLIIVIPSLLFGIIHWYSLYYIIYAFATGLALMAAYTARIETDKKTIILIIAVHMIKNIIAFSIDAVA